MNAIQQAEQSLKVSNFISLEQARRCLVIALRANVPVALWGESGLGKSTVVHDVAKAIEAKLFDFRMSDKEPTDCGLPVPHHETKKLEYYMNALLPFEEYVGKDLCILFLDEFDRSAPEMQNMALQLLFDRQVNGHKLGPNVRIILAGNGSTDVFTCPLSDAARKRMCHLYVSRAGDAGLTSYEKWAEDQGYEPEHVGFARFCYEEWSLGAEELEMEELGRPSSRGYDYCRLLWNVIVDTKSKKQLEVLDIITPLLSGCVGRAGGAAYQAWREMAAEAPDPKQVLQSPETAEIPGIDKLGILYKLITSVAETVDNHKDARKVGVYLTRVAEQGQKELAAMGFRRLVAHYENAATTPELVKFHKENKSIMR
jgi:hypothetical protein